MQRLIQAETALKLASQNPELHDMREIYHRIYKNLKIVDIDKILPKASPPVSGDPMQENEAALSGMAIKPTLMQDHEAHLIVHQKLLDDKKQESVDAMMANSPFDPTLLSSLSVHIMSHKRLKTIRFVAEQNGIDLAQHELTEEEVNNLPIDIQNQIAIELANGIISDQNKENEERMQNQKKDPTEMQLEVLMKDSDIREKALQLKTEVDMMKLQLEEQKMNNQKNSDENKLELERLKLSIEQSKNTPENFTPHEGL